MNVVFGSILVAIFWAISSIIEKVMLKDISSSTLLLYSSILFCVFMILTYMICPQWFQSNTEIDTKLKVYICMNAMIGYCISFGLLYYLMSIYPVHIVIPLSYISPLFVLLLSWLFLKEEIDRLSAIGVVCIVVGVMLISRSINS